MKKLDARNPETEVTVWRSINTSLPPPEPTQALPLERIDPVIRVAHRRGGGLPHLTFPERVIVDHEIVLILSGKGELSFRDKKVPWAAHDVLFLRPFIPHSFTSHGEVDHIAVHFDFSPRGGLEPDLKRRKPYSIKLAEGVELPTKQRVAADGAVQRSLSVAVEHFARGNEEGRLRAKGELLCALSALITPQSHERGELGRHRAQVERAIAYMREHLADPITNGDLQRASRLGSSQLHALFRKLSGYSPMDYLRRLRIERARALLANPALSIKEVAALVGFSEPNHFSRVFSRIDGVPPTAFREALLTGKTSR